MIKERTKRNIDLLNGSEISKFLEYKDDSKTNTKIVHETSTSLTKVMRCGNDTIRLIFMDDPVIDVKFDKTTGKVIDIKMGTKKHFALAMTLDEEFPGRKQLKEIFGDVFSSYDLTEYLNHKDEFIKVMKLNSTYEHDSKVLEARIGKWGTTDPNSFNESRPFRFIIHGFRVGSPSKFANQKFEADLLSCSLIDQIHLGTFADSGFILKVPVENILLANNGDVGPHDEVYGGDMLSEIWKGTFKPHIKSSASEILKFTSLTHHNEVGVTPLNVSTRSTIEVIGGFVKIDIDDKPLKDNVILHEVVQTCKDKGLPVIYIRSFNDHFLPQLALRKDET